MQISLIKEVAIERRWGENNAIGTLCPGDRVQYSAFREINIVELF